MAESMKRIRKERDASYEAVSLVAEYFPKLLLHPLYERLCAAYLIDGFTCGIYGNYELIFGRNV